jgi:type IV pilus assembly protein PilB
MKRLGELMVDCNLITSSQLDTALAWQKRENSYKKIGEILIDMGFLSYDSLLSFLDIQCAE